MKSVFSIFVVLMLFVTVFYSMQIVGNEVYFNDNLDNDSKTVITSFNAQLNNNFNYTNEFDPASNNLTNGSSNFDNEDVFAQQYLEGKRDAQQNIGIISTIWNMPDLIITSFGAEQSSVAWIKGILLTIIGALIAFVTFRAIFGGGKLD